MENVEEIPEAEIKIASGGHDASVQSTQAVVPVDVIEHDKLNKKIRVQHSNGDFIWVSTSRLLKDKRLKDRFIFFHVCEKSSF